VLRNITERVGHLQGKTIVGKEMLSNLAFVLRTLWTGTFSAR